MQSGDIPTPRKQPVAARVEEAFKKPKAKPSYPAQLSIDDFLKVSDA